MEAGIEDSLGLSYMGECWENTRKACKPRAVWRVIYFKASLIASFCLYFRNQVGI